MKMPITLAPLLFCTIVLLGCSESPDTQPDSETATATVMHVDPTAASDLLTSNADIVVLDVRTPAEHAEGHLPAKVINVDFKAENFREEAAKLDRDTPYLVHCRSGGRSTSSLEILTDLGFRNLHHLDGGITAWTEAGKELEK